MKVALFSIFAMCCATAHAACGNGVFTGNGIPCSDLIDIDFDINLDGATYAYCDGANKKTWTDSSTPGNFNWCRTELIVSSNRNTGRTSGICNSNDEQCSGARAYCTRIGGTYRAGTGC